MATISYEVYDLLEERLGRDEAKAVAQCIEASIKHLEERSKEIALQRKLEVKEELKRELREELTTKADLSRSEGSLREEIARVEGSLREEIARVEGSLRAELIRLDKKFSLYFLALIFTVVFLNQNALEFLAKVVGLVK